MPVLINLKPYLAELEMKERSKSAENQRPVPSLTELAQVVGMHRISFLRIANNQISKFDLNTADKIIAEMRRRGFPMQINDLLIFEEVEQNQANDE